jgi:GNAT superfamily N-acetyltransferase
MRSTIKSGLKNLPGEAFVAELNGRIIGAMRIAKWPDCKAFSVKILLPTLVATRGLGTLMRIMKVQNTWIKHDPRKPHWHGMFFGITPDFQGKGIGTQMMKFYCAFIDKDGTEAYHETDRARNVTFYQRFGFEVTGEETINGAKTWYMLRSAKSSK